MPCAKGMRDCRRDCLHRRVVQYYQMARHAWELDREAATANYPAEMAEYAQTNPGPTFKEWLKQSAGHRDHVEQLAEAS